MPFPLTFTDVSFSWPDGRQILHSTTFSFPRGLTGLIGPNGCGKSTLLRLITSELSPTTGHLGGTGAVGYLPQTFALRDEHTVADLLGISGVLTALRAIEAGDTSEQHFDVVGEDWDIEPRTRAGLSRFGLHLDLDRRLGTLSGGEATLVALIGVRLAGHPVNVLDEPTNNLDMATRARFLEAVREWPGTLIVASHDRELLEGVDQVVELEAATLSLTRGPLSVHEERVAAEQAAAEQALTTAQAELRSQQRLAELAETALARSARSGHRDRIEHRFPKILAGARRNRAQNTAGRVRQASAVRIDQARAAVAEQEERLRRSDSIRIDLPDPGLSSGRRIAEFLADPPVVISGPQRIGLQGRNGIGKTRLVEALVHGGQGARALTDRIGYLPQRVDHRWDHLCGLALLQRASPGTPTGELRSRLARFRLGADAVERPLGTLSGGERFRISLAALLLASPPPQLLVLDEPTNNLDHSSVAALVAALSGYRGALLIVSHDQEFLEAVATTTWLTLTEAGVMRQTGAPDAGPSPSGEAG